MLKKRKFANFDGFGNRSWIGAGRDQEWKG